MSNRHVEEMRNVYQHMFNDVCTEYADLKKEFERDLKRLLKIVSSRGIGVFVRDLPNLGKHFDRCLSEGAYVASGLPLGKAEPRHGKIPLFLRGLHLRVFDDLGCLRVDVDKGAIFWIRQFYMAMKKADLYCGDIAVDKEIDEFVITDESLPKPEQFWRGDAVSKTSIHATYHGFGDSPLISEAISRFPPERQEELTRTMACLDIVAGHVCCSLGEYNPDEWSFRHGPGAIADVTHPVDKYDWTNWSQRLDRVFPISEYGFYSYSSWIDNINKVQRHAGEPYSRLIAVPKTFSKPRLIAAEPREHQWCQQNLWHYFRTRTENSWIGIPLRFTDQTRNQRLCVEGSVDGSLCTVDLSAASDRVTCHAVAQLFRSNPAVLLALQATRTRRIKLKYTGGQTSELELRKFSTMGSACTFPVESLLFLSIAIACLLAKNRCQTTKSNIVHFAEKVSVFGDDIIVPVECRELLFDTLEALCFKVNQSKSFWKGYFRESCGVDAYAGVDVTPVYWHSITEDRPESVVSKVEVINNFYSKFILSTSSYLTSTLPRWVRENLPRIKADSGAFGLKSFVDPPPPLSKWNGNLHRWEYKALVIETKVTRTKTDCDSQLFQFFTEQPSPYTKWVAGYNERPKLKMKLRRVCADHLSR